MNFELSKRRCSNITIWLVLLIVPICIGFQILHLWNWDFSVPLAYGSPGADEVWQLVATKSLLDTGWVLNNPYMGAPAVSHWYNNSGAQTSALHSVIMLAIGVLIKDPVRVQQVYYVLNFDLIAISAYLACRLLGTERVASVAVGMVYSFTSFRIHALFFAYLSNYFVVPLAIVPAVWILSGKLALRPVRPFGFRSILQSLGGRRFLTSLFIILLTAVADGYYSFFTLLLLGLSIGCRAFLGDLKRPARLMAPAALICAMVLAVLALNAPLINYRYHHPEEADQDQMKQPTDAEVYAPSLKLLVAPIVDHRLAEMRKLSQHLITTANFNRKFPYQVGAPVVLGTFGTILLLVSLWMLMFGASVVQTAGEGPAEICTERCLSILAIFVLLCSVTGGIGSLIALIFPTIRAYERFPIFLVFQLWALGGLLISSALRTRGLAHRILACIGVVVVVMAAILDQTPHDPLGLTNAATVAAREDRFLAERSFVHQVEADQPSGALVYQYPYSQYLTNNRYYGWGAFGQLRLYLHSKELHWSNGGAKGSPAENWEERISALPIDQYMAILEATGFTGLVIDRLVYPDADYAVLREQLELLIGPPVLQDAAAKLAYWRLPKAPYHIDYAENFKDIQTITVSRGFDPTSSYLPPGINKIALYHMLGASQGPYPIVIDRSRSPAIFRNEEDADMGFGQRRIPFPDKALSGGVECRSDSHGAMLTVVNDGDYDWRLNVGDFPIRVAASLVGPDGKAVADVFVPGVQLIESHAKVELRVPWSFFTEHASAMAAGGVANFAMLQDGNVWFRLPSERQCSVIVPAAPK